MRVLFYAVLTCWLGLVASSQADPYRQEVEEQLIKIQAQIQKSQHQLEEDRDELGKLEKELRRSEQMLGQLNRKLNESESILEDSHQRVQELATQKQRLSKKLSVHRRILYTHIRSEYLYGGQGKLKLLLNQQEPTKLARTLVYYDYLQRARLRKIEQVREILLSIDEVQTGIMEEQNSIAQMKVELLNQKQRLERQQQNRKSILADLNARVSTEQVRLIDLEDDERRLKELIKNLGETSDSMPILKEGQRFQEFKGRLYWPVTGKPGNQYGQRRNSGPGKLRWQGVFIPSDEGNNVHSIFAGRVAFAEWMRGLGLLIIVDHGDGYMSLYGHNQSLYKHPGEWVNAGERIATVGNSGGNTRAGLYFEIRKQGKPVNPEIWCTRPVSAMSPG